MLTQGKFRITPSKLMASLEVARATNNRPLSAPPGLRRRRAPAPPKAGKFCQLLCLGLALDSRCGLFKLARLFLIGRRLPKQKGNVLVLYRQNQPPPMGHRFGRIHAFPASRDDRFSSWVAQVKHDIGSSSTARAPSTQGRCQSELRTFAVSWNPRVFSASNASALLSPRRIQVTHNVRIFDGD